MAFKSIGFKKTYWTVFRTLDIGVSATRPFNQFLIQSYGGEQGRTRAILPYFYYSGITPGFVFLRSFEQVSFR